MFADLLVRLGYRQYLATLPCALCAGAGFDRGSAADVCGACRGSRELSSWRWAGAELPADFVDEVSALAAASPGVADAVSMWAAAEPGSAARDEAVIEMARALDRQRRPEHSVHSRSNELEQRLAQRERIRTAVEAAGGVDKAADQAELPRAVVSDMLVSLYSYAPETYRRLGVDG